MPWVYPPPWHPDRCHPHRGGTELELWARVLLYGLIFGLSVVGNALVVAVLALNRRLRTVTNLFLMSLALSDLLLALCCMPFTLLPNLMGTFIFGEVICKLMAYLMGRWRGKGLGGHWVLGAEGMPAGVAPRWASPWSGCCQGGYLLWGGSKEGISGAGVSAGWAASCPRWHQDGYLLD